MKLNEIFLNEVELGGGLAKVDFDHYDAELQDADFSGHKQYDLFPEIPTLTLPKGWQRVGSMGEYIIIKKFEDYEDFDDRRGFSKGKLPGYIYILIKGTKPIGYVYTVEKQLQYGPDLQGRGLLTKNVYIDKSERGKNLALKFYYWLLCNVTDYIIPDEMHTHAGAALWRKLNQSRLFDMYVYDPRTGMSRKRWAGKDWNQIYNNDDLQPFLTKKGRWVETDEYESDLPYNTEEE